MTHIVKFVAESLLSGGVIIFPTETVYGLGVLPWNVEGVRRIYEIKGRPLEKRLSLYFSSPKTIMPWVEVSEYEALILRSNLPGPYTFVVKRASNSPMPLAPGFFGETLGVRCPDHAGCLDLLTECGGVMAGTSANLTGKPDAREVKEIDGRIAGSVDAILDSGPAKLGEPSTVVDLPGRRILRVGIVPFIFP